MKDQTIFLIFGILLVGALFYINQEPEPLGIEVEYYKDGKKVSGLFGVFVEYDQIRLGIYATNTGGLDLNTVQITDASPQIFKDALPTTIQTLKAGDVNKNLWNSNLIDTSQLAELPQPVEFWVRISGKDEFDNTIYQETTFSLTFVEEVGGIDRTILLYINQAPLIWNTDLAGESVEEFENVKFDTFKDATKIDITNSDIDDTPIFGAVVFDDFEDGIIDTNIWAATPADGVIEEKEGDLVITPRISANWIIADQINALDFNQDFTFFVIQNPSENLYLIDEHSNQVKVSDTDLGTLRFEVDPVNNNVQLYKNDIDGSGLVTQKDVSSLNDGDEWHIKFRATSTILGGAYRIRNIRYLLNSPVSKDFVSEVTTTDETIEDAILIIDETRNPGTSADYYLSADNGVHWEQTELNKIHKFTNTGTNLKLKVTMKSTADQVYQLNKYAIFYNLHHYSTLDYPIPSVKFRTTDLSYSSGSSVAVTDICGNQLIGLGYDKEELLWGSTCDYTMGCSVEPFFSVPCSFASDCKACVNDVFGDIYSVSICSEEADKYMLYLVDNPSSIDTSPEMINPAYEVPCGG